ncbi:MAG TPA: hypothetical protein VJ781_02705 [Pyrinomonadaceae bacterium]|nr:hypothetical protein [Pyrinomonadaceae bacterium]
MKIIGILLLFLGLFLMVVGFGASLFFFMNPAGNLECTFAEFDKEKVDQAEKEMQAVKGTPEEATLTPAYEAAKRTAYLSQTKCNEIKTQKTVFTVVGGVAGVLGFFLALGGIGALIFGIKRARPA